MSGQGNARASPKSSLLHFEMNKGCGARASWSMVKSTYCYWSLSLSLSQCGPLQKDENDD